MEILFELVLELVLDGSIEVSKNKKVSPWIRYPLIFLIVIFSLAIIALFFIVGFLAYTKNKILAFSFISLGIILLILGIKRFKEIYLKRKDSYGKNNK